MAQADKRRGDKSGLIVPRDACTMRCHTSIAKTFGLLILGIFMVALSWFCTTIPSLIANIFGWIGVAFSGLCLIAIAIQLFRRKPSVTVDASGVNDLRSSFGTIPWRDIELIWIGETHGQRFLCVRVQDPAEYVARLSIHRRALARANASLGFPPVTIGFSGLKPGLDDLWKYLQLHHPEKLAA